MEPKVEIKSKEIKTEKENFLKRNMQVFKMALGLAVIFLILIFISMFLEKTEPKLIPVEETTTEYKE